MANASIAAFGLRPVRRLDGSPWSAGVMKCNVASNYGTALFVGDPVNFAGAATTDGKYPTIGVATAGSGNKISGVIVGILPDPSLTLNRTYLPASTGGYVLVDVNPFTVFQVRDDGSTTLAYTDIMANAVLAAGGGGSTTTGFSSWVLDSTTGTATTAAHQLRILGLSDITGNELAAYGVYDVLINNHIFGTNAGITAV